LSGLRPEEAGVRGGALAVLTSLVVVGKVRGQFKK
jgi:hypothetical protein